MNANIVGMASSLAVLAAVISWGLCSAISGLAKLDHPTARSLHTVPTPRAGGLAILGGLYSVIVLGMAVVWSGAVVVELPAAFPPAASWILGATLVIMAVSCWDDYRPIKPGVRLAIHVVAAAGLVRGIGGLVTSVPVPLMGHVMLGWGAVPFGFLLIVWMSRLLGGTITGVAEGALVLAIGFVAYVIATGGQIIGEVLSLAVLVLCLVWMANLYNFMDGMDGFAGGMTVIGHGFLSVLAWQGGHQLIFVLSLLVAGAAFGFLIWNFPPAKMFMGDAGSIPLGFLTGALALVGVHDRLFDAWVPLLIFSPFVVDATATLIRRLLNGEKVWKAHRSHHYQRLVLAGWGHRRTVLAEYGLMFCCGGLALAYQYGTEGWRLVSLGVWCLVFVLAAVGVRVVEGQAVREQPAS